MISPHITVTAITLWLFCVCLLLQSYWSPLYKIIWDRVENYLITAWSCPGSSHCSAKCYHHHNPPQSSTQLKCPGSLKCTLGKNDPPDWRRFFERKVSTPFLLWSHILIGFWISVVYFSRFCHHSGKLSSRVHCTQKKNGLKISITGFLPSVHHINSHLFVCGADHWAAPGSPDLSRCQPMSDLVLSFSTPTSCPSLVSAPMTGTENNQTGKIIII